MNISDFIITVTVSLLAGIGLGLTIKETWRKVKEKTIRQQKTLKRVDFSHFFNNDNEEIK